MEKIRLKPSKTKKTNMIPSKTRKVDPEKVRKAIRAEEIAVGTVRKAFLLKRAGKELAASLKSQNIPFHAVGVRVSTEEILVYAPRRSKADECVPLTWKKIRVTVIAGGKPVPA